MTQPYITNLVENLAEAAYNARFSEQFERGYARRWSDPGLGDDARAVWRRVGAAVLKVATARIAHTVRIYGGHQGWSRLYEETIGCNNDSEIYHLEPFMLRFMSVLAAEIQREANLIAEAATQEPSNG